MIEVDNIRKDQIEIIDYPNPDIKKVLLDVSVADIKLEPDDYEELLYKSAEFDSREHKIKMLQQVMADWDITYSQLRPKKPRRF